MPIQRGPCRDSGGTVPPQISSSRDCGVADAAWAIPATIAASAALGIDRVAARYDATQSSESVISLPFGGIRAPPGR